MKERPIIMAGESMCGIIAGRKTQTRRVMKPQPLWEPPFWTWAGAGWTGDVVRPVPGHSLSTRCPYGAPGDLLWVKEGFYCDDFEYPNGNRADHLRMMEYRASHHCRDWEAECPCANKEEDRPSAWRSPLFMPRWASRLTLRVTDVRVERVQDISEDDARAEGLARVTKDGTLFKYGVPDRDGLPGNDDYGWYWREWEKDPRQAYRKLWDAINAKRGFSWESNPWVWAVVFEPVLEEAADA